METSPLTEKWMPFFDRTTALQAQDELALQSSYWNQIKTAMMMPPPESMDNEAAQATFVLTDSDIRKLKDFIRKMRPDITHLSSFTVICSHLWVCMAKLAAAFEEIADEEPHYFSTVADCKALLKPSLPENYFGNCLALLKAESNHATLKGNEGFLMAGEIIGKSILKTKELQIEKQNKADIVVNHLEEYAKTYGKWTLMFTGSPRFDFYSVDFGWGRVTKHYQVITGSRPRLVSASLGRWRQESHGGVEIYVSMQKVYLDGFTSIFTQMLEGYTD